MSATIDAAGSDIHRKGLKKDAVGLLGSTTIGLASTAPAFSLAATIAFLVLAVGTQAPAAMLLAFVPMLFTALAYRELNRVIPDCGTTFTWATKAFGPHVGWMGGWGIAATGIIFVANAADVVGNYTLALFNREDLQASRKAVVGIGLLFIILMTWVAYRGIEGSARMQYALVGIQFIVLIAVAIIALRSVFSAEPAEGSLTPELGWLNPFGFDNWSAFTKAILLGIFIYWGWDTVLSINEETTDSSKTPGRAAVLSTVLLLAIYLLVTYAVISYAGVGETSLITEDNSADVLNVVAEPLLGSIGTPILLLTVLLSTAASLQTTIMPTARSALAMSVYKAMPVRFGRVQPKYLTPSFSTIMMGVVGAVFYIGFKYISDNLLQDTILSIGLGISFYYGITAFTAVWYFRKEAFAGLRAFCLLFLLPLLGGLMLAAAFVKSAIDMWSPDYGSTTLLGIGGVFVCGIGALLVGVVLMFIWQAIAPAFFRRETLRHDTAVLAPE